MPRCHCNHDGEICCDGKYIVASNGLIPHFWVDFHAYPDPTTAIQSIISNSTVSTSQPLTHPAPPRGDNDRDIHVNRGYLMIDYEDAKPWLESMGTTYAKQQQHYQQKH